MQPGCSTSELLFGSEFVPCNARTGRSPSTARRVGHPRDRVGPCTARDTAAARAGRCSRGATATASIRAYARLTAIGPFEALHGTNSDPKQQLARAAGPADGETVLLPGDAGNRGAGRVASATSGRRSPGDVLKVAQAMSLCTHERQAGASGDLHPNSDDRHGEALGLPARSATTASWPLVAGGWSTGSSRQRRLADRRPPAARVRGHAGGDPAVR